jgi:hypothetical protein
MSTKPKTKSVSKKSTPPEAESSVASPDEQAASWRRLLRASTLAKDIFDDASPSTTLILGVGDALSSFGDDEEMAVPALKEAARITRELAVVGEDDDIFDIFEAVLADDDAEAHLKDAKSKAVLLFGTSRDLDGIEENFALEDVVALYSRVYGKEDLASDF